MKIWMVCIELVAKAEGSRLSAEIGFMNVTTWADSKEEAVGKIQKYLESVGWRLVSVERAHVVDEDGQYGDAERIRSKGRAIIPMP